MAEATITVCNGLRAEEFEEYVEARAERGQWTDDERGAARKFMDECLAIEDLMELDPMEIFDLELHAGFKMGEVYSGEDRNDIRNAQSQREKMDLVLLRLENNVGGYRTLLEFLISPVIENDNLARRIAYEETQRASLTDFYKSMRGPDWTFNEDWTTTEPITNWFGLDSDDNDAIAVIVLQENNLEGPIPESFCDLRKLQIANFKNNSITQAIPPTIAQNDILTVLNLCNNQLRGAIPDELGACKQLRELHLEYNNFSGTIPPSFKDLYRLRYLNLESNSMSGLLEDVIFATMPDLEMLDLRGNNFFGELPPSLGNCSKLKRLSLGSNMFMGTIPDSWGQCIELEILFLQKNKLVGPIPPSFCNMTKIAQLILFGNKLTGTIPADIGNCKQLLGLDLSSNRSAVYSA
jgi:hypothetical protein